MHYAQPPGGFGPRRLPGASRPVPDALPPTDLVPAFLELSTAVGLTSAEERALLDVSAAELALLRTAPANALDGGGPKLQRRLQYAVTLLRRMLASATV